MEFNLSHNLGDSVIFLQESISVILPADVAIFEYPEVEPVNPAPVLPEAVEIPSQFSPLVKLTINVNSQQVITSIITTLLKYCCSFLFQLIKHQLEIVLQKQRVLKVSNTYYYFLLSILILLKKVQVIFFCVLYILLSLLNFQAPAPVEVNPVDVIAVNPVDVVAVNPFNRNNI